MAITQTQTLTGFHLRNRIRAIFSSTTPVEQLDELKNEAKQSLLELEYLYLIKTPPLQLVAFYAAVSPWCDRSAKLYQLERDLASIDYGQYEKARKALLALATQEERSIHGVNQTSPGQIPSMDTTLLGGHRCCGLATKTVSYWESKRNEYENKLALIGQSDSPTIMAVIDERALELLSDGIDRWSLLLQNIIDS
jgi:hypothetical protein